MLRNKQPRWVALLASKRLLHITLPVIMLYLVAGTIAQKSIGLLEATHRYFMAPFVEFKGVLLPGMPVFVAVLVVNLLAHLCLRTEWSRARAGTILTHFGVIFLLCGALLTSLTAEEGYMDLREGARSNYATDYHERMLVVRNISARQAYAIPFDRLLESPRTPQHLPNHLTLQVDEICSNCALERRSKVDEHTYGMARGMQLAPKPSAANDEENLAGMTFTVEGSAQDGRYTTLEKVAVLPQFSVAGDRYAVSIEKQRRPLPFTVQLLRTSRTLYPGTDEAKAYRSRLRIDDHGSLWEADLAMNQPVRYKGYALFQSTYVEDEKGRRSVIAVVHNPIRTFPYIATAIIALGLVLHLLRRSNARTWSMAWLLGAILFYAPQGHAAITEQYDLQALSRLPVLSEGRIKPLESIARERMKFISGSEQHAVSKLATALFFPDQAEAMPWVRVPESGVRVLLELPPAKQHRYSIEMLREAFAAHTEVLQKNLEKPEAELDPAQHDLRQSYLRYKALRDISHSFDPYRALAFHAGDFPPDLKAKLHGKELLTFENTMPLQERIERETTALVKRKGSDFRQYTRSEQSLSYLSFVLASMRAAGEQGAPFAVVHNEDYTDFVAPWDIVLNGEGGPGYAMSLQQWKTLIEQAGKPAAWNATLQQMLQQFHPGIGYRVEWWSDQLPLRALALGAYGFTLVTLLLLHALQRTKHNPFVAYPLVVAVVAHGLAVLVRILILGRPPVGTLYESILFAGWLLAAFCCVLYYRRRDPLWLWPAAIGGLLLIILAMANDMPAGDNKTMLSAVLNTNFWLSTHVLAITAGYAFSLLTALLAHMLLITRRENLYPLMKRMALLALLFTATGTLLGGIWADQSWGRFWGWDPKENGALLIVLWLVWFIHGDVTRSMPRPVVVAGLALLAIIVALSWFGVNLLNIGLHSYGFTHGVQTGLAAFCVVEILFVLLIVWRNRQQRVTT